MKIMVQMFTLITLGSLLEWLPIVKNGILGGIVKFVISLVIVGKICQMLGR